jgi:hypothetical protein
MTVNRLFLRGIVVGFFLCLTGSLAFGASNRTWVSGGTGTNNPNCSRTQPCDTFQHALAVTNAGGEIDILDPGDFQPVNITQSVSIVADGVLGGIFASGGNGITVNAGASDVVVLRGLTIDGDGTGFAAGIQLNSGGTLHIESCTINNFSFDGIIVGPSASSQVFIKDTITRNNASSGIQFASSGSATVTGSLDNVRTENNVNGLEADNNTNVSVRNSVSAGNRSSGFVAFSTGGRAVINLESTIAPGNGTGVRADGANATINMSNVAVVNNGTGLSSSSGGHVVSFGNNKITDNTTNGSPTKTIAQK